MGTLFNLFCGIIEFSRQDAKSQRFFHGKIELICVEGGTLCRFGAIKPVTGKAATMKAF
jgi:hypothetical protein